MSSSLPKLSYVLLSHNREKYIRAAIESAFAQDYEGELEYIFSDDCSTDRTFDIIKECVASYKGNRRVVVTQTPRNLHLAGNTNHAVQFVESDWVIRADDDDISHVSRCTLIGKAIAAYPTCRYVFARMELFTDSNAEDIDRARKQTLSTDVAYYEFPHTTGCEDSARKFAETDCLHQAWHISVYREFGPLPEDGYYVDDVMSHYRAMAMGSGVVADTIAAYIRTASNNMSKGNDTGDRGYAGIMKLEKFHDKYYNMVLRPLRETLTQIQEYAGQGKQPLLIHTITDFVQQNEAYALFWRKGCLYRFSVTRRYAKLNVFSLIRCLPMPAFAAILSFIRKLLSRA